MSKRDSLNLSAEKIVLASLIARPNKIFDVDNILITEKDFSSSITACIYSAIKTLSEDMSATEGEQEIDSIILEQKIADLFPEFYSRDSEHTNETIKSIKSSPIPTEIDKHLQIIIAESTKRKTKRKLKSVLKNVDSAIDPILLVQGVETDIFDFTNSLFNTSDSIKIGQGFGEFLKNRIEDAKNGNLQIGIASGFDLYDKAIGGGFRSGTVNIIAARSKRQKSFLAMNIARNVAKRGIPVLYLDTELDKQYQMTRLAAQISNVSLLAIESGQLSENEVDKLRKSYDEITNLPIYYVEIKGHKIEQQISIIRRWFAKIVKKNDEGSYNNALVILDWLKLMDPSDKGKNQEWETLGYRMSALHDLMAQHNNPMFMLAQQNRDGMNKEDETTISGSDRVIFLCDNFSILSFKSSAEMIATQAHYEQEGKQEQKWANMRLKVVVARHGIGTADSYIGMYSDLRDYKTSDDEKCGIIKEIALEKPYVDK